jgi:DNA-binding NarL/FixJ family response regulator
MNSKTIRILIVDDHKLFRRALITLISQFSISLKFHEASNGMEALQVLSKDAIDLVLLDIQMPEMGGIETLKQIRCDGKQTKVVVLTQFDDKSLIVYLLQLGANGFLFKACEPKELERAIVSVMKEGHYYNHQVLEALEHNLSCDEKLTNLDISPREFQVMILLKEGKSNKEVAANLGLTVRTIESYRKRLIKKQTAKTRLS